MGTQFIQLEEFDESLRGRRICAYLPTNGTNPRDYIRLIISNVQASGGEPLTKCICVTGDTIYRMLADSIGASMIISPKDNNDLSIILTATNQAPSHTLVIIFPDAIKYPDQFYQRMPANSTLLVIKACDDTSILGSCNVYMMPHVREIESTEHHSIIRRLHALGITQYDLNAVIKELRMAHAGLLVTVHSSATMARRTELYWWNTSEEIPHIRRRPEIIGEILRFLAEGMN